MRILLFGAVTCSFLKSARKALMMVEKSAGPVEVTHLAHLVKILVREK